MATFAGMRTMDVWYSHIGEDELTTLIGQVGRQAEKAASRRRSSAKAEKRTQAAMTKAHTRDSLQALSKLGESRRRPVPDRLAAADRRARARPRGDLRPFGRRARARIHEQFRSYRATLQLDRRQLLERFEIVDMARKVVGVGSVGTRAFIALLQGRDDQDPLFLQVKQATASVLEDHLPKSRYKNPGERVVQGQRLMQAASDIFLGWTKGLEEGRYFYWRQLRDMKVSFDG